jgi:hypothetical protein
VRSPGAWPLLVPRRTERHSLVEAASFWCRCCNIPLQARASHVYGGFRQLLVRTFVPASVEVRHQLCFRSRCRLGIPLLLRRTKRRLRLSLPVVVMVRVLGSGCDGSSSGRRDTSLQHVSLRRTEPGVSDASLSPKRTSSGLMPIQAHSPQNDVAGRPHTESGTMARAPPHVCSFGKLFCSADSDGDAPPPEVFTLAFHRGCLCGFDRK